MFKSLHDAFLEELKMALSGERQLVKALPKIAKKANHPELKQAIEMHLQQTEEHVNRIEQVFDALGQTPRAKKAEAMEGLIDQGETIATESADPEVKDAMLIAACQEVEHHEIACYGTLCTWADTLNLGEPVGLLKQTLAEEKETDARLTQLAQQINAQAAHAA
jgi:ferritin-like metal-binding protein YciE